ncbi:MAG: ABC transporter ATP-binding protein [Rickettsiaceae bacterium]|nr:ABC transporter ATP-binding protein [Rickettsiaceae bacterium]MDP4832493.1 ABC transporter ATP-binding protein [Rickettsiaceae bacterium]MDP5020494.1 ABC transporter ATP-binding protein [Rickettsiaceae bacterium]MDP5083667.1 ABC transporter ATP-binding protein [Rickettsiaceae bacterium]
MNNQILLTLKNISKDYKQGRSVIEVLKGINLEVCAGQTIAIVGASGSGKSTLLHIAGLLDAPDSGNIEIAGVPSDKIMNLRYANQIRLEHMGFIYQHHHLLSDFTAQENAAMPLFIQGIRKSEAMDKAADLLEQLGLGKRLYNVPGELSGGEQQRVAVARALINNPKIILADEPTGNLDPHTAEEVFAMFLERAEKFATAIVMVSHNLELAAKMQKTFKLDCGLVEI